jgi:hypothetical protein
VAGQTTRIGKVTAISSTTTIIKSDPASYFGVAANADFNGDAIVDAGDYVIWRKNSGLASGAARAQGDANADGTVNNTDYNLWRGQFGSAPGAGNGSSLIEMTRTEAAADSNEMQSSSTPIDARATALAFSALNESTDDSNHRRFVSRDSARALAIPFDWFSLLDDLAERKLRDHAAVVDFAEGPFALAKNPDQGDVSSRIRCSFVKPLVTIGSEFADLL